MDVWKRLRALMSGRTPAIPLALRRERREAARRRHRSAGEPLWASEDRHLGAEGERWVADVSPGTPGHFGFLGQIGLFETANGIPHGPAAIALGIVVAILVVPVRRLVRYVISREPRH